MPGLLAMYIAVSSMVLQSYTIFSARNSSTILFLHHSWSIGTNTNYWWGVFSVMGCPSSPSDEHSQQVWESQLWQSKRSRTPVSPTCICYRRPEDFWKSSSQATASRSIPHSRVCLSLLEPKSIYPTTKLFCFWTQPGLYEAQSANTKLNCKESHLRHICSNWFIRNCSLFWCYVSHRDSLWTSGSPMFP